MGSKGVDSFGGGYGIGIENYGGETGNYGSGTGGYGFGMGNYGSSDSEWDGCCEVKNVWGSSNPTMDGVYVIVGKRWDIPSVCNSQCVYVKIDESGAGIGGYGIGESAMGCKKSN